MPINSDPSSAGPPLHLWLVNQYALRRDQPGITRHATLAALMHPYGVETTIFASDTHYWNVANKGDWHPGPDDPHFIHVRTPSIERNGIKRVLSMLAFSGRVVKSGWRSTGPSGQPDIVLGSSPHPFGALSAWVLAKRHHVPFVLEVRDLWPDSLIQLMGLGERHPLVVVLRGLERFLYRRADLVITLLPGSEKHIERIAGRSVRTLWVPNGIDLSVGPPVTDPVESSQPFTVMYAGAHGIPNALETVLQAAEILERRHFPARFVLIGSGKEKPHLQELARESALETVEFREAIAKSTLMAVLPTADALVITFRATSLYRSGISPNKVFDYMAASRPVLIAVDTPLNPINNASSGITTPPEDADALATAIEELARLPLEQRVQMGRRGRRYVEEHHDMARLASTLASALRGVSGNRTSRLKRSDPS